MWGNLQGWIISGVMLAVSVGLMAWLASPPGESAPVGLVPLAYKPVALPVSPDSVLPAGTDASDAGPLYHDAIDELMANPKTYHNAARVELSELPALSKVLQAANCANMHLFEQNPTQLINYDNKKPWADAMMALGEATCNAGLRLKATGNIPDAIKYYDAAFAMGRKMSDEHFAWRELNDGMSIMDMAVEGLTEIADAKHDSAQVDLLQKFESQTKQYRTELEDKVASPLGNPVESYAAPFAGDIFAVAKNRSADPVWRVEAILHLGRYHINAADGHRGDQLWAPRELAAIANSPDPKDQSIAIKTAVHAAQNFTVEQQRMTGGG